MKTDLTWFDNTYILHPFSQYKPQDVNITIEKGSGALLFDTAGKSYIDAIGSWWVNLHGHAHPQIAQAIATQARKLEQVIFSGFTHAPAVELAQALQAVLPEGLTHFFFSDNGSTAVEVALKMAHQYHRLQGTPRRGYVALSGGYHGDTFGAMAVGERDVFVAPYQDLLFPVHFITPPTLENIATLATEFAEILAREKPAAFIYEPLIQGAGGMHMYDAEALNVLLDICKTQGVLTIADEVMTGFGKTGTLFASSQMSIMPDLMCLSKGLTGGFLPLGLTVMQAPIFKTIRETTPDQSFYHGHSFTGNPLSCAAALASLTLLQQPHTQAAMKRIEAYHRQFKNAHAGHPVLRNIRVKGVVLALDFGVASDTYMYLNPLKEKLYAFFMERGVLLRPLGNVVYIIPPYCISDEQLMRVYEVIEEAALTWKD